MKWPDDDIRIFNDSLDRYVADSRSLDIFYEKFVGGSERVAARFAGTDMERQKRTLKASLYTAMLAADGNQPAIEHLQQLSLRHREMDIEPELYDLWLESLIATVHECAGAVDLRVERAWRNVLAVAINFMRDGPAGGTGETTAE